MFYRLQQFGILSHWKSSIEGAGNNYMRPYFAKGDNVAGEPKKISFQNLSSLFWLLGGGVVLASVVFTIEIIQSYLKN